MFAGDHGVVAEGVTPWPQEVTAQMVANFVAGGAAINVLARQAGATVTVVDVGVATDLDAARCRRCPGLLRAPRSAPAPANLAVEAGDDATTRPSRPATSAPKSHPTWSAGARARLVTGEMGIGNTTAAAAVIAALTGRSAAEVTGRGTGIDDARLRQKIAVVDAAVARLPSTPSSARADAVAVLAEVGGLEIAALAGFIVGGAAHRVPVVVDGVIARRRRCSPQWRTAQDVLPYVVAGHRSTEPGATAVLEHLGLEPVIDLGLRLGEGSGACLALGVLEAAARILNEMATFDAVGITNKD